MFALQFWIFKILVSICTFLKAPVVDAPEVDITNIKLSEPPNYKKGDKLATRQAYGTALVKVGKNNDRVCGLDGDMKNSTFSQELRKIFPERYLQIQILLNSVLFFQR